MNDVCSIELLQKAVACRLSSDDEAALYAHLEHCEACCAQMDQLAGGEAWQREAAAMLTKDELDAGVSDPAAWSEVDFSVEHLDPSNDPNVLGQLGGYDVLAIVGRGGMGVVLKAFDRELKRLVAIKALAPHLAHSSVARKRFAREAQAAAAVVNPHVIAIHHVQPTGRLPFLIMPLLTGESLAQRLKVRGPLELTEVLRIGMQAAVGLAAAHDQGLVHRDVKPANIFLEKGVERVVITDFGLARAADDVSMTRQGVVAGTPEYMSPEQARGDALDGRSDLFSLGCVLYEMATGVSPFRADSTIATVRRIVDEKPTAMASLVPELPPWFIHIVERLLSKDPAQRFVSASEVSELLEQCLSHLQQPTSVPLPASLGPHASGRRSIFNSTRLGVIAMLGTIGLTLLGMVMWLAPEPPDIKGTWTSDEWGTVVLESKQPGRYEGTLTNALFALGNIPDPHPEWNGEKCASCHEGASGKIELEWSRLERRFNGTWNLPTNQTGKLSLRLVDDQVRGAWTTSKKAEANPGTPRLGDLTWNRNREAASAAVVQLGEPGLFIYNSPGSWKLSGGVSLEIVAREHSGEFGKVYRAILHWPANGELPALRYEVDIASEKHRQWAVAGKMDAPVLWLVVEGQFQSGSSIRTIDYSTPANIITSTVYGDDRFDLKIPELDEAQQSRRIAFSIGGQGQQVPKDLDALLVKRFGHSEPMKYGISSLLPTGLHQAGGQHAEAAVTEDQWTFSGCVRTVAGIPVPHVVVTARDEVNPTIAIASATTDADGRYQIRIRSDVFTLMKFRSVTIEPRVEGLAKGDTVLRSGFSLRLARDEDTVAFSRRVNEELRHTQLPRDRWYVVDDLDLSQPFGGKVAVMGETTTVDFVVARQDETSRVEVHYIGDLSIWDRWGRSQQIGLLCKYLGVATGESTAADIPYASYDAARMSLLVRASAAKHQEITQQLDALREDRVGPAEERLKDKLTKVYRIAGLPLWSKDGKNQDANLLIRYLRAALDPAWKNQATHAVYDAEKLSLVVLATADVHDKIAIALTQLGESSPDVGDARSVAEAYVAAVLVGSFAEAATLAKGSPAVRQQIEQLSANLKLNRLAMKSVFVNDPAKPTSALAISEQVTLEIKGGAGPDGRRDGFLVLTLTMNEEGWFVTNVDYQTKEGAEDERKRFEEANPNVTLLPGIDNGIDTTTTAAGKDKNARGRVPGDTAAKLLGRLQGEWKAMSVDFGNGNMIGEQEVVIRDHVGLIKYLQGGKLGLQASFELSWMNPNRPEEVQVTFDPNSDDPEPSVMGLIECDGKSFRLCCQSEGRPRLLCPGEGVVYIECTKQVRSEQPEIEKDAEPVPEAEAELDRKNARSVVEAYIAAVLVGRVEKAASLAKGSPAVRQQIEPLSAILNRNRLYVNDPAKPTKALAMSETPTLEIKADSGYIGRLEGFLLLTLSMTEEGWFVTDVNHLTKERAEDELKTFLEANPNAIGLPSQSPGVTQAITESPLGPKSERSVARTMFRIQSEEKVIGLTWSPDCRILAVGSNRGIVSLFDGTNGAKLRTLRLLTDEELAGLDASDLVIHAEIRALEFSPDCTQLAVGNGLGQVKLFNVSTGELIRAFDDEQAKLAETKNPDILKSLRRGMGSVASLAFSPDGSLLATCGGSFADFSRATGSVDRMGRKLTGPGRLKVWEVNRGTVKHDLVGHSDANMVAFSSDGSLLASAGRWSDNSNKGDGVIVWNPQAGEKLRTISLPSNGGTHTAEFSPNGKKLLISSRHFDKENDTSTTTISLAFALSGVTEWQQTLDGLAMPKMFSPDGKSVFVLCGGQSIRVMDAETGDTTTEVPSAVFPSDGVLREESWNELAISPDGTRLAIGGVDSKKENFVQVVEFSSPASSPSN